MSRMQEIVEGLDILYKNNSDASLCIGYDCLMVSAEDTDDGCPQSSFSEDDLSKLRSLNWDISIEDGTMSWKHYI